MFVTGKIDLTENKIITMIFCGSILNKKGYNNSKLYLQRGSKCRKNPFQFQKLRFIIGVVNISILETDTQPNRIKKGMLYLY